MLKQSTFSCLSLLTLSSLLAACGGGGGGGSTPKPSSVAASSSLVTVSSSPVSSSSSSSSSAIAGLIKLNQIGYKPNAEKLAVVPAGSATTFTVKDANNAVVLTGSLSTAKTWTPASESVQLANFSSITTEGTYTLSVEGIQNPASFKVTVTAYDALNAAAIKAFYFNRASTELLETHAGVYKRAAGHLDNLVYVHESAQTPQFPTGTPISAPKGWYDAGDYNLYIVNSGITTYTLLAAYEKYGSYFEEKDLNIPESGDSVPDILDEAMWNLEWMLAMQDEFGGVYHKLTSKEFSGFVMPSADKSERFVVGKTTSAALNFAAVMATASRIYLDYEGTYPGMSARMLNAAVKAWNWAEANPAVYYIQPGDITTGEYKDFDVRDEKAWAAAELFITTNDITYLSTFKLSTASDQVPSWQNVKALAWISLAHHIDSLSSADDKALVKTKLNSIASGIASQKSGSAYGVPLTNNDFYWGSNSGALNKALMLTVAYELDNTKTEYLKTAQSLLDYVLGRNPTDYSFVTGFGVRTPQNVHHRPSGADSIPGSIPGFVAGGANGENKTDCTKSYPTPPAKAYLDEQCSYMTNEIAINWNAPLVYVSAALQVLIE